MDKIDSLKTDLKSNGSLKTSSSPPCEALTINNNETSDKYEVVKDGVSEEETKTHSLKV